MKKYDDGIKNLKHNLLNSATIRYTK